MKKYGSPTYTADAAPGSSLAMNFTGAEGEYFSADISVGAPNDNFILEAWVRPNRITDEPMFIVYNGGGDRDGYGLIVSGRGGSAC